MGAKSTITLAVPAGFSLPMAVSSYGYFMLAPNRWDSAQRVLHRPLVGHHHRIIHVAIRHRVPDRLQINCDCCVDRAEAGQLRHAVGRMLRALEDLQPWHRLHPAARRANFGRLFRSPTLFEDLVKTMTTCNVAWPNTMRMNELLCQQFGNGGFPTPEQLVRVRVSALQRRCKIGYRASWVVQLASQIVRGELDLDWFEDPRHSTDVIYKRLRGILGIGDYAASNMCQLLGRYDRVAIDSETYRHFRQHHGRVLPTSPKKCNQLIDSHFARYAPFQFLAYWFELWGSYEKRKGE